MKDRDYEVLQAQYSRTIGHVKDLQEQLRSKEAQWAQLEAKWKVTDDHIKQFCEMILAKNPKEMQLGKSKPWSAYPTDELIARAKASLIEYLGQRKDVQNKLMQACEEYAQEIESLKFQVAYLEQNGASMTGAEVEAQRQKQETEEKAVEKTSAAIQSAVKAGKVTMVVEEDGEFVEEAEVEQIQEAMDTSKAVLFADAADQVKVKRSKEKNMAMQKAQEAAASMVTLNVKELTQGFRDEEWNFLRCMGEIGHSKFDDILAYCAPERTPSDIKKYRTAGAVLRSAGIIDTIVVRLPIAKSLQAMVMTPRGKQLYEMTFHAKPVVSEYDKICAEHDNAVHGYGIAELEQVLIASNQYKTISSFNRANPITVTVSGQSMQYVPDIICKNDRFTDYYEYERGTNMQVDFNTKCNKMCAVTRYLNFVCPNREIILKLKKQVDEWVKSRGGAKQLANYTLRITSTQRLQEKQEWQIEYKFNQGEEPVKFIK